ncbi:MAG: hypothetical protein HRU09_16060 [Oligoflexales bacterium]|nr:hypothetical protein [Oligoflexales bacterium]
MNLACYGIVCVIVSFAIGPLLFFFGLCKCAESEYWLWSGINSIPAIVLSLLLCLFVINSQERLSRKKLSLLLLGFYFLSFLDLTFWLWFHPQKRISHFVFGFLHGPIYDRYLPIDMGIIYHRAAHFFLGLGILYSYLARFYLVKDSQVKNYGGLSLDGSWNHVKMRFLPLGLLFCYFISAGLASQYPSVGQGASHLKEVLPETYEEELFAVHYIKGKDDKYVKAARNLVLESRFHLLELIRILELPHPSKVQIYAYPSSLTKKLAFGGGGTDVTDVYTPSIHIQLTSQIYRTLRHELVHALGSDFGFHGLGFHPNMALTEGLAVALAPELRTPDLHEGSYELIKSNKIGSIEDLFSPFFWKVAGARSYTISGSLVSYLLESYGSHGLKRLYAGDSFLQAYKMSTEQIIDDWKQFISEKSQGKENTILAEAIYRSPGTLYERCTHSKPVLRKNAMKADALFSRCSEI